MEKMKQECKVKKPLKIWQGVLTLLVSAVILFVAAPILLSPFGMYGSLLGELLLFGVAVGAVLLFQGDLREVFPLKKPHFSGIAGTILIWVGTFLCEMVLLLMGYLLWETGNMCYNMLFHFINNALPVILLYAMQGVYSRMELYMEAQTLAQGTQDMLPAVGMYLMMASAAPGAIYIGNYLLHAKTPGYRTKLFPSGKPGLVIGLILGSLFLFAAGLLVFFISVARML